MFDAVRNNPKIVQGFLALITLPFAFFGIEAYFNSSGAGREAAAKVGSVEIPVLQLDQAVREQENSLRAQYGANFDRSILETPEFRASVLDRLINETVVASTVRKSRIEVSLPVIQAFIKNMPQFQDNGQFSMPLYESIVRSQGFTPQGYEQKVRESLAQEQLLTPIIQSAITPKTSAERWITLGNEERTVSAWDFGAAAFVADVKLADDAAKKFYDAHPERFQVPEQVKLEYVVVSQDQIAAQQPASEADARKWYDENLKNFGSPEERRASHILVQVGSDAKPEVKAAARKKADELLAKLKSAPAKFAEIAKAVSDDKLSAEKGGDLGFFAVGGVTPAIEKIAFSMKPHELSGIVESEFGFHIVMLTDVRGGTKPFEAVRGEALDAVRKQASDKRFAELADQFANLVYEQPDALKPIADKLGLKLQQSDWIARGLAPEGVLQNEKLQAAVFSSESITNKRNTEAVDLGNSSIISARVTEHKAAAVKPFEEVKAQVTVLVTNEEAAKIARARGEESLRKLSSGEVLNAVWKDAKAVKRGTQGLDNASRKAIFGAPVQKLPAYVGVENPGGYSVLRIEKVSAPSSEADADRMKSISEQYSLVLGQEDLRAFIAAVRTREGVSIKPSKEEKK